MKKHFIYLFLFFAFISCSDKATFNNPTFEGQKDNVFWRANEAKAMLGPSGSLLIEGYKSNEKLTLKTASNNPQTYVLGSSSSNMASYVLTDINSSVTFSTGYDVGDGQIVIEEYDAINNTVTGTFRFNAKNIYNNALAGSILNFQHGHFYKIPVTSF